MKDATKITIYTSNPVDTELIRLFEAKQYASNRDALPVQYPRQDMETDSDRLDAAIEMAQILRDHCIENALMLAQADVRLRIERAVEELQNDRADPSVCYESAMCALLHGLEGMGNPFTKAS